MAKVTSDETNLGGVAEMEPEVESVEDNETEENSVVYQNRALQGGLNQVFASVTEAKENPVTFADDNSTPKQVIKTKVKDSDGNPTGEITEKEVDLYKLFELMQPQEEGSDTIVPVGYVWERSNAAAVVTYAELALSIDCRAFGAKRGRVKRFKPDQSILTLATSIRESGDKNAESMFLAVFPAYTYVFKNEPMPETI